MVQPIDIREMRAMRLTNIDGPWPRPLGHPQHGHPVGQVRCGGMPEALGCGPRGPEAFDLDRPQSGQSRSILVCGGRSGVRHQATLASRFLRIAEDTWEMRTRMIAKKKTAEAMTFASAGIPRAAEM